MKTAIIEITAHMHTVNNYQNCFTNIWFGIPSVVLSDWKDWQPDFIGLVKQLNGSTYMKIGCYHLVSLREDYNWINRNYYIVVTTSSQEARQYLTREKVYRDCYPEPLNNKDWRKDHKSMWQTSSGAWMSA